MIDVAAVWSEAREYVTDYLARRHPDVPREEIRRKVDAAPGLRKTSLPCPIAFAILRHEARGAQ